MCSAGALRVHCGCIEGALEDAFVRALPGALADALQVHSMCILCALYVHWMCICKCIAGAK